MFAYCLNNPVNNADYQGGWTVEVTKENNTVSINMKKKVNCGSIDLVIVLEIEVGYSPNYAFEVGEIVFTLKEDGVNIDFPNGFNADYDYNSVYQIPESVEKSLDIGSGFGLFAGVSAEGIGFGATYEDDIQSWTLTFQPKIDPTSVAPAGGGFSGVGGGVSGNVGGFYTGGIGCPLRNPTFMYSFM